MCVCVYSSPYITLSLFVERIQMSEWKIERTLMKYYQNNDDVDLEFD